VFEVSFTKFAENIITFFIRWRSWCRWGWIHIYINTSSMGYAVITRGIFCFRSLSTTPFVIQKSSYLKNRM
jgi:hypothetical protein